MRSIKDKYLSSSDIFGLIFFIIITFGVSYWASMYQPGTWYVDINKPSWTPPGWIFPIVWTLLYLMMSVSVWLVWKEKLNLFRNISIVFYFIQLALNGLWSYIFFGQYQIGLAVIDIILLFVTIMICIVYFWKVNRVAGILLTPYLIWVGFASILNATIWILN